MVLSAVYNIETMMHILVLINCTLRIGVLIGWFIRANQSNTPVSVSFNVKQTYTKSILETSFKWDI